MYYEQDYIMRLIHDMERLKLALLFYGHLNTYSDAFLEKADFSREEIRAGIENTLELYGYKGVEELLSE